MTPSEWDIHKQNFQTILRAAKDHRRLCIARARHQTEPGVEAAVICVVNSQDDGDVELIPVARMLTDPEEFAGKFTLDPLAPPAERR